MRLEQIEALIEISNSHSISIAAQNLYVSQPALSRSVKALEDELGLPLLSRTVDGVRLTTEGQTLLPGLLEDIGRRFPGIQVKVCMLSMEQLPRLVIPHDADLILGINVSGLLDSSILESGLHLQPLFTGNSYLVVGKNHPLAHKKIITREEMLKQKLIIHYNGFDLDILYDALSEISHPIHVLFCSNNTRLITQTLEKQEVALLTNNLLLQMDYNDNKNLSVIPIKNSRSQYFCLYKEDHPQLLFIQELIESLNAVRLHL